MKHVLIGRKKGFDNTNFYIKNIIQSLMEKEEESNVELVFIDTKNKFDSYKGHPCLINDMVSTSDQAIKRLQWVLDEVYDRIKRSKLANVYNNTRYNYLLEKGYIKNEDNPEKMKTMVVVVDDLKDLMKHKYEKEVESLIIKIAQLGHYVGIHLVVATDSGSEKVITLLINAVIPTVVGYTPYRKEERQIKMNSYHPKQIPTTKETINKIKWQYDFKISNALAKCIFNEDNENLYKNNLITAAICFERISCLIYEDDGVYKKLTGEE